MNFILSFWLPFGLRRLDAAESKPNWQAEWERTVQAAKKEGSLSLYLFQGEGELGTVAQLFQKKYPEINVVTTPGGVIRSRRASWRSGVRASISSMFTSAE